MYLVQWFATCTGPLRDRREQMHTHICTVSAVHQVKVSLVVGAKLAAVTSP